MVSHGVEPKPAPGGQAAKQVLGFNSSRFKLGVSVVTIASTTQGNCFLFCRRSGVLFTRRVLLPTFVYSLLARRVFSVWCGLLSLMLNASSLLLPSCWSRRRGQRAICLRYAGHKKEGDGDIPGLALSRCSRWCCSPLPVCCCGRSHHAMGGAGPSSDGDDSTVRIGIPSLHVLSPSVLRLASGDCCWLKSMSVNCAASAVSVFDIVTLIDASAYREVRTPCLTSTPS